MARIICGDCGHRYCDCKHKECPECARKQAAGSVLMEYTGTSPMARFLSYTFTPEQRRVYVTKEDVARLANVPALRRVEAGG